MSGDDLRSRDFAVAAANALATIPPPYRGPADARVIGALQRVEAAAEALRKRARVFRGVPLRLFTDPGAQSRGAKVFVTDLIPAQAVYPFDVLEVQFNEPLRASTSPESGNTLSLTLLVFAAIRAAGDIVMHSVFAGHQASLRPVVIWTRRDVVIDPQTGEVRWSSEGEPECEIMPRAGAIVAWNGLISLCAALTSCRSELQVDRVDPATNEPFRNRQARRDNERNGRPTYLITLRPGTTLRAAIKAVRSARRTIVRSRPRRHRVKDFVRRYHTKRGVEQRSIAQYWRGGHLGGDRREAYDTRRLFPLDETARRSP